MWETLRRGIRQGGELFGYPDDPGAVVDDVLGRAYALHVQLVTASAVARARGARDGADLNGRHFDAWDNFAGQRGLPWTVGTEAFALHQQQVEELFELVKAAGGGR